MMFDDINDEHRFMSDFVIIDEKYLDPFKDNSIVWMSWLTLHNLMCMDISYLEVLTVVLGMLVCVHTI